MVSRTPAPDSFAASPPLPILWPFDVTFVMTLTASGTTEDEARDALTETVDRLNGNSVLLGFDPSGSQIWAHNLIADPVTSELADPDQPTEFEWDDVQFFDAKTHMLDPRGNVVPKPAPGPYVIRSFADRLRRAISIIIRGY